jgi:hypothetical protein
MLSTQATTTNNSMECMLPTTASFWSILIFSFYL